MRRSTILSSLLLAALATALTVVTTKVDADDTLVPRPPRIQPPGKSLAGTDDSDAIALNPAQIAFMPSYELRYTHVQLPKDATTLQPGRGDALGFATPLLFGLATGVRLDLVRPPEASPLPRMTAFTWALALKLADSAAIAIDVRRWYSDDLDSVDGATSIDVGYAERFSRFLGFAFVARDLNGPRGHIVSPNATISRSFDFGLAIRPLGTRVIELGLETTLWGRSFSGEPTWTPRATLGFDIPRIGRALLAAQVNDPTNNTSAKNSWFLTAGIEFVAGYGRLGGGVVAGKGLGSTGPGWYVTAAQTGYVDPGVGIKFPDRAVTIRIEETPSTRGHVHLLRRLAKLGRDPGVRAIVLIMKAEPASSTAHAEELADMIAALQQKGVKVLCHFEDTGGKGLLACASADRILLQPAGGVRFAGLRSQTMYFGEGLRKIGIEPDFIRIKEHKSAPEAFVREGPTPQAEIDQKEFLAEVEKIYLERLAQGRHLTPAQVKTQIAKGPFVADEAIAAGLADAKAFDDEIPKHVREVVGEYVRVVEDDPDTEAPKSFGTQPKIAIVYIDGDIVDGRSQNIPLLGEKMAGSYTIAETLKQVREDSSVKGVIVRIESPGGSSLASDVMWREAELLGKSKPTIVSMGSVAASGGYYAAAFGVPIYADRGTVTGSIGIFYGKADISGLLTKLGVHVVTHKTAPKADAESFYRPFTDEERNELEVKVGEFYAVFLDRVARGRKMSIEAVDAVGHGKVWLGDQAKAHGLIDVVGGIDAAFGALRAQLDEGPDIAVEELPVEKNGLLDLVLGLMGAEAPPPSVASLPKLLGQYARAVAPFIVYRPDEPLAMWEGLEAP